MTEEDTFNALRRCSINIVDEELLRAFNFPNFSIPLDCEQYSIELDGDVELALFNIILSAHYWDTSAYLRNTQIGWVLNYSK